MYTTRVDDKGRLKVPVDFQKYVKTFPEKKLFVTSLDRRIGQIYPIAAWRKNQEFFFNYRENPAVAKRVAFNANDLGGDSEMDKDGRVLLPPELRKELQIENQPVRVCANRGRIEIYSEAVYQEWRRQSAGTSEQDVVELERAGLM
jgi:MraZ protein